MNRYELSKISDLLKVPADRRSACLAQLELCLDTAELLYGEKAEDALKSIEWTDDADHSVAVNQNGEEGAYLLKVTEATA